MFSDGEDLEGDPSRIATVLMEEGIAVFGMMFGTETGSVIQITASDGTTDFVRDASGNPVVTRARPQAFADLLQLTGGALLDDIRAMDIASFAESTHQARMLPREWYWLFSLMALFTLFLWAMPGRSRLLNQKF